MITGWLGLGLGSTCNSNWLFLVKDAFTNCRLKGRENPSANRFWVGGRVAFLILYDCFTNREALMESLLVRLTEGKRRIWAEVLNDWELEIVALFLHTLYSNIPHIEVYACDRMRWRLRRSGEFDLRSFYTDLRGSCVVLSLGKAFGVLRPHGGFPSLFGW